MHDNKFATRFIV